MSTCSIFILFSLLLTRLHRRTVAFDQEMARRVRAEDGHRHVTEQLKLSESRFGRLFDAGILGIFFIDCSGRITGGNDAFLQLIGYGPEDFPLRCDQLTPEGSDQAWTNGDELFANPAQSPCERELLRKDFQGDLPMQIGVLGDVDLAHAAGSELLENAEVGECLADHGKRGGSYRTISAEEAQIGTNKRRNGAYGGV